MNIEVLFLLGLNQAGDPSAGDIPNNLLHRSHFIAGHVAYPVLEGLMKRLCSRDIEPDGTVKSEDTVKFLGSRTDYYQPEGNFNTCSSIRDILYHFEKEIAGEELEDRLSQAREFIREFGDNRAYGLLQDWRNSLLHGQDQADVQYGIVLLLICMVVWHRISEENPIEGDWNS